MAKKEIKRVDTLPTKGRPTEYRPEFCEMMEQYFSVKPYQEKNGKLEASDIPTLAGFAISIGIHRETLLNWCKTYPDFFDAFKRAKEYQENWLSINGNKGLINPAFSIFTAKNIINWRDKKDVEITGNVTNLTDEELEKKLLEKLNK